MKAKDHLTLPGLKNILAYKKQLNWGLSENLEKAFPDIIDLEKPSYVPMAEELDND